MGSGPAARSLYVRGTVLPDGDVRDIFVVDGRFTFHPQDDAETLLDGGYLVPGLVDAHAHLSLHSPAGDDAPPEQRVRASATAQLAAGVLAVREPGSPDRASLGLGPAEGLPRTETAGRFLAAPGRYFPGLGREVEAGELPDAAADEALASGACAKVIADFFTEGDIRQTFPADALAEAARRVHVLGARITAHATCTEAIQACLEAGFDSIEHATMLTLDQLDQVVAQGTVLVPTLLIRDGVLAALEHLGADAAVLARIRAALYAQPEVVRQAAERGVPILAGTDAGMVPHGLVAGEIALLLDAGLSPEQALGAGSWQARDYLGLPGIAEGAPADLVAYPDDPREDVAALRRPALIMLDGRRI